MGRIRTMHMTAMVTMALISFTNLFGIRAAGSSVLLGIVFFFVTKAREKQAFPGSGLDFGAIRSNLKDRSIWLWLAIPLIMDAVCIMLAKLFLPEYILHVISRAGHLVSFDKLAPLVVQLAVLALGEEIAWRAFFQKQLHKVLPIAPVLLVSSLFFAIGHIASGSLFVVVYDIFFVFVNSIIYGVIFHKTNNAWMSAISHFVANLFGAIVLVRLLQ